MGVDIYMRWSGQAEDEKKAQFTGFQTKGDVGYLRGAYFGGLSDVLRVLFDWVDWGDHEDEESAAPFEADKFEGQLNKIKALDGKRPGAMSRATGVERVILADIEAHEYTANAQGRAAYARFKGEWEAHQNAGIPDWAIEEYEAFLALGRRLEAEGKEPTVYISG